MLRIKPMAAKTNALSSGEAPRVIAPGEQFTASFRIETFHHK
jgi:hypothetical protein